MKPFHYDFQEAYTFVKELEKHQDCIYDLPIREDKVSRAVTHPDLVSETERTDFSQVWIKTDFSCNVLEVLLKFIPIWSLNFSGEF